VQIDLSGKTALVTGGNVGIGQAIALALAESGADVALTYLSHDDDSAVQAVQARGQRALGVRMEVVLNR
jgi:NAD(P)-dependent dehydrogenase (short-subunit alcohol dehydrogenase family)